MSSQLTLSGIVLEQGTEKRLASATVRLETPTGVLFQETDKDGKFVFKKVEEPDLTEGQDKYKISLYAHNKEGSHSQYISLDIKKGKKLENVRIEMVNQGPISNTAGKVFLVILIALLMALVYCYYNTHNKNLNKDTREVDPTIVNMLTESLVDRITADSTKISAFKFVKDSVDGAYQEFITAEIKQIEEAANELFKAAQVDTAIQLMVFRNLEDVKQATDQSNRDALLAALVTSKSSIEEVKNFRISWFWRTTPKLYFEIVFWALFATLLRLIGNTSYYVSRNIFYKDSISHKAALLFTIPLIALLITFVISFFKIVISLGDATINLDFTNPFVSIILASLIGLAPWRAWEFMYGLADKLFVTLKKWIGLEKAGDEPAEDKDSNPSDEEPNEVVEKVDSP